MIADVLTAGIGYLISRRPVAGRMTDVSGQVLACTPSAGEMERPGLLVAAFAEKQMERAIGHEVHENIFIGNRHALTGLVWLLSTANITFVLNCAEEVNWAVPSSASDRVEYRKIGMIEARYDKHKGSSDFGVTEQETTDLKNWLWSAADTIHGAVSAGHRVLVNCKFGYNRSASSVLVYLLRFHATPVLQGLVKLRAARPKIYPNLETWPALLALEKQVLGFNSISEAEVLEWHLWAPKVRAAVAASGSSAAAAAGSSEARSS